MNLQRRDFLRGSAAAAALAVGGCVGDAPPQWTRTTVHHMAWPVHRPLTIAHLTDLHLGWGAPEPLLSRTLRMCREHRPDLTVLTGDYLINSLEHIQDLGALARRLPRPCLATLGNHDHRAGAGVVQEVFQRAGIPVLRNASYRLTVRDTPLVVVGIDDGYTEHHDVDRAMSDLLPGERAIVLSHLPDLVDEVSGYGDHLVLAGHTHGGQIYFPLVSPFLADLAGHRYLAGWYEVGGAQLYVNVGIGCARFRRRIGARAQPELAIIKLLPSRDASRDA
jgi:hypothetical protein